VAKYTVVTAKYGGAGVCNGDALFFYARQELNLDMLFRRVFGVELKSTSVELPSTYSVKVSSKVDLIDGRSAAS
jgi:hypothetical protein